VVSVTRLEGGSAFNVIPDRVTLQGTVRCFDESLRTRLRERISALVEGLCRAMGAIGEVRFLEDGYPSLVCDERAVIRFLEQANAILGEQRVRCMPPGMGGEDFAYYALEVPSCFWLLGVRTPGVPDWPFLHTDRYDFNDEAIETALRIQSAIALLPPVPR
jgi:metal-dependent amidase/aminoacylase/carboxypeptidase family protein